MGPPEITRYQADGHASVVTLHFPDIRTGWEQWFLLRSDVHLDNTHCDRKLAKRHLEEAKARSAYVLDFGDLHCAMQGKWDPRRSFSQCPPELRVDNYLTALTDYQFEFHRLYAKQIALIIPGNHETSVFGRQQVDLTEELAKALRRHQSPVQVGTYRGWVRFQFTINSTQRSTVDLHYTHGYGGGGPVTKDMIQASRQLAYLAECDILASGHTHDAWHCPVPREGLSNNGWPTRKTVDVVKLGTYKDEFGGSGWSIEKGHGPKPLGAFWLRFYYLNKQIRREFIWAGGD